MRFSAVHKFASYLMVGAAFLALALSRELSLPVLALTAAGIAGSWFAEPQRIALLRRAAWTTTWNVVTLLGFGLAVLEAVRGEVLASGVRFLCLLLVNKLWNRRASRDYLQAYVISFLMLVAGAALSADVTYALCFLLYTIAATWTLTLFHLRREMEENYLVKHSEGAHSERVEVERILNSRRIVGGSFLGGTALVSLGVFLSSTVLFFLIPRVGFGLFATRNRRGVSTVGFSERVELGEYGLVKDNPTVIMRVELPGGPPPGPLRMRGVSFDRYARGQWSRTAKVAPEGSRRWGETTLVGKWAGTGPKDRPKPADVEARLRGARQQNVYLEPLDTAVLFGSTVPIAFRVPQPAAARHTLELDVRGAGEVIAVERHVEPGTLRTYSVERKNGIRYTVWSDERLPNPVALASLADRPPDANIPPELAPYLALPAELPRRIGALAVQVTERARGPYSKAVALERHLQSAYRYTLDLKRDDRYEPLEDFLFVQRAGHCEYFASAMAVMLRTLGIPSRTVNGFYGGEWNPYGSYLAIRQGDAHTWVEAYFDGVGWVTFDPTPAGAPGASSRGVGEVLRQLFDTVELAWFKWVIEYDLGKQAEAISSLRKWAGGGEESASVWRVLSSKRTLGVGAALLAAAALITAARRRRPTGPRPVRPAQGERAQRAFERAARALEGRGFPRAEGETAKELARRVSDGADPGADAFDRLVALYYAARFGGADVATADLDHLADEVVRARRIDPPQPAQ